MITSVQLSDPARGMTSVLKPREGIAYGGHEFTPAVRVSADSKAGEDGSLDSTTWLDAGAVTLTLTFYTGSRALMDEVAAYLVPWARPYLIITDDGWVSPRQVQLRTDSYQHPIERGRGLVREVQYSWSAPRGMWEDTAAQTWLIAATSPDTLGIAVTAAGGVAVTAAGGVAAMAAPAPGVSQIFVYGNARPRGRAHMYGPATGPELARDDIGAAFGFGDTMILASGEYVEIDRAAKTALFMSEPDASRLAMVDWTASEWFPLDPAGPGNWPNLLRYHATSGTDSSSYVELTCWPVWMP